jgi:DNA-directed RNA polymerase specialized sigma24 family protein
MVTESTSPREHAEGWLYRASVREALDELRRVTRHQRFERFLSFLRDHPHTPEHLRAQDTASEVPCSGC